MSKLWKKLSVATFLLTAVATVNAVGPYTYNGNGGVGDWGKWAYPNVQNHQTQWASFELFTGTAASDPDMHWAFGLRGQSTKVPCPVSNAPALANGCPLGRGLAVGKMPDGLGGTCTGVAVEHFTEAYVFAPQVKVIGGTCVNYNFVDNARYKFDIHVSQLNVYWVLYEGEYAEVWNPATRRYTYQWRWTQAAQGGCAESAGRYCAEYEPFDKDYADVFVASAFLDAGRTWRVSNLNIGHF